VVGSSCFSCNSEFVAVPAAWSEPIEKLRNLESLLSSSALLLLYTTIAGVDSVDSTVEATDGVVQSAVADEPFANTVAAIVSGTARALADAHQAAAVSNIDTAHDTMVVISYVVPETEIRWRICILYKYIWRKLS